MRHKIGSYIRQHHLALVALFVALTGTAYATTVARNTVRSSSIENGQVKNVDLASGAVTGGKIAPGAVDASKIKKPPPIPFGDGLSGVNACLTTPGLMCAHDASNRWNNQPPAPGYAWPAYYVDGDGFVHLQGFVQLLYGGSLANYNQVMFTMPISLKPSNLLDTGQLQFLAQCDNCNPTQDDEIIVVVSTTGTPELQIKSAANPTNGEIHGGDIVSLNGISWGTS